MSFRNTWMATWTVPDRLGFKHYHPHRKAPDLSEKEARAMATDLERDGARNIVVIDTAKPWRWSEDGTRTQAV
jgi:hypothetical protein